MTDLLHSMSLEVVDAAGRGVPVDDQRRAMMLRTVGLHRIVRRDCDEMLCATVRMLHKAGASQQARRD